MVSAEVGDTIGLLVELTVMEGVGDGGGGGGGGGATIWTFTVNFAEAENAVAVPFARTRIE